MIKVLFVDDEILAMEYLQNMISWEEQGFQVVGHVRSGKKALEFCEKEIPDVVISDIKMPGMDGLELSKKLKEKNKEMIIVLLSAYRDFEYAKKGMEFGVFNYLLKHELCKEKLVEELEKIKNQIQERKNIRKIYQTYFAKQLIYDSTSVVEMVDLGNRFFLLMIHKDDMFKDGSILEQEWNQNELDQLSDIFETTNEEITYLANVRLTPNNLIVLYKIQKICSRYQVRSGIESTARKIAYTLGNIENCQFNLLFSDEITKEKIKTTFQRMSGYIRYAVFWKPRCVYDLERMKETDNVEKISWNSRKEELKIQIYEGIQAPDDLITFLFEMVKYPEQNLRGLKELIYILENLVREIEEQEGFEMEKEETENKIDCIQQYYIKPELFMSI